MQEYKERRKADALLPKAEKAVVRVDILMLLLQRLATVYVQKESMVGTPSENPVHFVAVAGVVVAARH